MKWQGKIKNFYVTGDLHGNFTSIEYFFKEFNPEENALVILGDASFNFYLNDRDVKGKEAVQNLGGLVYCVRGNHEERPENLYMHFEYDDVVKGYVYFEDKYSNIRYFKDGEIYYLNQYSVLVIGGAYSVDKFWRLSHFKGTNGWTGWFKDEQLTEDEMKQISDNVKGKTIDFVFSHTCPSVWEPRDLFLKMINQNTVDKSMEYWFDDLKNNIKWNIAWLFGHFHDNRIVRPHVEMYYTDFSSLSDIEKRWKDWDDGYRLNWWLKLDPNYYFWQEEFDKRKSK